MEAQLYTQKVDIVEVVRQPITLGDPSNVQTVETGIETTRLRQIFILKISELELLQHIWCNYLHTLSVNTIIF